MIVMIHLFEHELNTTHLMAAETRMQMILTEGAVLETRDKVLSATHVEVHSHIGSRQQVSEVII